MCAIDLRAFTPPARPENAVYLYSSSQLTAVRIPIDGQPSYLGYRVNLHFPIGSSQTPPVVLSGADAPNTETVIRPSAKRALTQGTPGNDRMIGSDGDDEFNGQDGDDIITGGDGNDTLEGGIGYNLMRGGSGRDTFRITRRTVSPYDYDTRTWNIETDTIEDFEPEDDTIDLSAFLSLNAQPAALYIH